MAEGTNVKFDAKINDMESYQKICKIRSNGNTARVTWPTFTYCAASICTEWLKIKPSNLVCRLTRSPVQKIAKLGQMRTGPGSRNLVQNFGNPSISTERLKIQTSNLVRRLTTR